MRMYLEWGEVEALVIPFTFLVYSCSNYSYFKGLLLDSSTVTYYDYIIICNQFTSLVPL